MRQPENEERIKVKVFKGKTEQEVNMMCEHFLRTYPGKHSIKVQKIEINRPYRGHNEYVLTIYYTLFEPRDKLIVLKDMDTIADDDCW